MPEWGPFLATVLLLLLAPLAVPPGSAQQRRRNVQRSAGPIFFRAVLRGRGVPFRRGVRQHPGQSIVRSVHWTRISHRSLDRCFISSRLRAFFEARVQGTGTATLVTSEVLLDCTNVGISGPCAFMVDPSFQFSGTADVTPISGSEVPEPSSLLLIAGALAFGISWRGRSSRL